MPYTDPERRIFDEEIETIIDQMVGLQDGATPGDLNLVLTSLIHRYLNSYRFGYGKINEVIGVLECAKLELYRKIAAPYEDQKQMENGPVSNLDAGQRSSGRPSVQVPRPTPPPLHEWREGDVRE